MAKTIFDDAIIHDALTINDIPQFSMVDLQNIKTSENEQFWISNIESQLQAVCSTLRNLYRIPSRDLLQHVSRDNPFDWNPLETINQYIDQSNESFEEQKTVLKLNIAQIKKY